MPNTHETLTSLFADIADAIREKTGGTAEIVADDFPDEISSIPSGGDVTIETLSVTENGTYTAPTGKAYSPVTVNVPTGSSDPHVIHYTPATRVGSVTFEHGLGYAPTMCVFLCLDNTSGTTGKTKAIVACSNLDTINGRIVGYNNSGNQDNNNISHMITDATETEVTISSSPWAFDAGAEYIFVIN